LLDVTASSLLPVTWMNYAAGVTIYGDSAQTVNFTFSTNFFPSKDVVIDQVYVIAGNPPVDGNPPNITVPEPASLALLGSGLLGLALMVNRRRRQG
jgi:hypothetical protein